LSGSPGSDRRELGGFGISTVAVAIAVSAWRINRGYLFFVFYQAVPHSLVDTNTRFLSHPPGFIEPSLHHGYAPPMTILLTGFEPFGVNSENPSRDIVSAVDAAWDQKRELITQVLPVEYDAAGAAILDLIARHQPRAVLMLGLMEAAPRARLERVALNLDDASLSDNAGVTRRGETIIRAAPLALKTRLDLNALAGGLEAKGHGVDISNHAGAYICNHIYYEALFRLAEMGAPTPCLFVHVPSYPEADDERAQYLAAHATLARDLLALICE